MPNPISKPVNTCIYNVAATQAKYIESVATKPDDQTLLIVDWLVLKVGEVGLDHLILSNETVDNIHG